MLYTIVSVLVIILDQWVKYWVQGNIAMGAGIRELIPGVISLVNVHNDGAALSFLSGSNARIYFIIICGVFTVGVIIALATNLISGPLGRWSAVFVIAGGISNCIDRILYGYVQDMFKVELFEFAVFNVADIFITVFCFVFILYVFFGGEKESRYEDDDDQYDEDDEDEDDEDDEGSRRSLFSRRRRDDEDDEDDEDERPVRRTRAREEESAPRRERAQPRQKSAKQQRRTRYEEEYEQYKAARAARLKAQAEQEAAAGAPAQSVRSQPRAIDPSDPFAEWERANARAEANRGDLVNAANGARPAQRPVQQPVQRPVPSVQQSVKQAAPAAKADDEFDLDSILAEFK